MDGICQQEKDQGCSNQNRQDFLGKIFLVVIEILYDMEEPDYEKIGRIEAGKGVPVF